MPGTTVSNTIPTNVWANQPSRNQGLPLQDNMNGYNPGMIDPSLQQMVLPTINDHMMGANRVLLQSQMMLQNLNIGAEQTIWGGMIPALMQQLGIQNKGVSAPPELQQQMQQIQHMLNQVQNIRMQMPPGMFRDYTFGAGVEHLQGMVNFWYPPQ